MELILPDMREGYLTLVDTVLFKGKKIAPRNLSTCELTDVTIVLEDAASVRLPVGVGRKVNQRLAAIEALDLISGTIHPELLKRASPRYGDVMVAPDDMKYGSYGLRTRSQLYDILYLLQSDASSRQAVMIIWGDGDLTHKGDKPCTLSLQFLLRDDKLQLSVMMRSQDIILGTPYDIFMFSELQRTVARLLDVDAGKYVHHVGSCHFYVRDLPIIAGLKLTTLTENTLPRGVILPHKRSDILWLHHELEALLDHGPDAVDEEFRALNPWYCTQIGKLFEKETEEKTA